MKISFIGAGNVATHLAKIFYKRDYCVAQIFSRSIEAASQLANMVNAEPINDLTLLNTDSDLYIFSVSDSALPQILPSIPSNKGLWLHTAGSISVDIFKPYTHRYGVLYPFQTFTKQREIDWRDVPIFIESPHHSDLRLLYSIARKLSNRFSELSSEKRKYLHLTGVFACNFVNHMYVLSKQILESEGLPFDVALPLIEETCKKAREMNPIDAQTGPAVRFDVDIMEKHLSMIEDQSVREIYKLISESIHKNKIEK